MSFSEMNLNRLHQWADETARHWHDLFSTKCESPIEIQLCAAFATLMQLNGDAIVTEFHRFEDWESLKSEVCSSQLERSMTLILVQQRVQKYRADMIVGRSAHVARPGSEYVRVKLPPIVVECDGHDFHERTKEQAQRDKARDRALQTAGMRVIRFTGSEIVRDPFKCAKEIELMLKRLEQECEKERRPRVKPMPEHAERRKVV